jgi:hypothetical protein
VSPFPDLEPAKAAPIAPGLNAAASPSMELAWRK